MQNTIKPGMTLILLLSLSLLVSPMTWAHELAQTSAQIIIRNGQVEVRVFVNREHWLETLQDPLTWLTGESDFNLDATLDNQDEINQTLRDYLAAAIQLTLDNSALNLTGINQITPVEADDYTEYRFSATHSFANPKHLDVQFPQTLGEVYVSVVKPTYGLVPAGATGSFLIK